MVTAGYQTYKQNSVMTASPRELILMLYNGGIKFCNLAIEAFECNNIANQHKYIMKLQDIVVELQLALNESVPMSAEFKDKYELMEGLLLKANLSKDIKQIEIVKVMFTEFRDIWKEVIKLA